MIENRNIVALGEEETNYNNQIYTLPVLLMSIQLSHLSQYIHQVVFRVRYSLNHVQRLE